jgi:hypothetical protein
LGEAARTPNAKRAIRAAGREQARGLDGYAHTALQAALAQTKVERRQQTRAERAAAEAEAWAQRQAKHKKRLRGH